MNQSKKAALIITNVITIDKAIPLPPRLSRHRKYPWDEMEVGDSFLIAGKGLDGISSAALHSASKRLGRKFLKRKVNDGLRIWRIE